jgi:2-polyprenyl-6-methoxyphenol hydroxylase-like FAD-dependent oxidoreductase
MMYNVHATVAGPDPAGAAAAAGGSGHPPSTPVLIVGGGLAGLCASLFLSHHGVRSVLAERRISTSPQPKARRINMRTMELFRQVGIDGEVTRAAAALADWQGMAAGPTLARAERLPFTPPGGNPDWASHSPMASCLCSQDVLEPVLRELAGQRGGDLRFGTEVTDLAGDGDGVTATLRGPGGAVSRVRAGYVIAADGARSPVRERLGIPRSGRGALSRSVSIYFRADLAGVVRGREFNLCQIENPAAPGAFASVDGDQRWLFGTPAGPDRSPEQYAQLIETAIGAPGTGVQVLSVLEWESGMLVADRLRAGRVFLAGDAAHVMPPYAALGANTGIQDAHNLAWKLALVLGGEAAAGLLDSYHAERHAASWFAAEQSSVRRFNLRTINAASTDGTPLADPLALIFGGQYTSGAVISDGSTAATDRLDLHGQPGTRLPHQWLAGGQRSTLDLLDHGRLTLLTGPAGAAWALAAPELAGSRLAVVMVSQPGWEQACGIGPGGALLVRPDQIVAWRSPGPAADPAAALGTALATLLGDREPVPGPYEPVPGPY